MNAAERYAGMQTVTSATSHFDPWMTPDRHCSPRMPLWSGPRTPGADLLARRSATVWLDRARCGPGTAAGSGHERLAPARHAEVPRSWVGEHSRLTHRHGAVCSSGPCRAWCCEPVRCLTLTGYEVGHPRLEATINPDMDLYLDLMKRCLMDGIYGDDDAGPDPTDGRYDSGLRSHGQSGGTWPSHAHTMIGQRRLDNIQHCVESVIRDRVPGDLIETGVWRGGATIFMRSLLKAMGITDRTVWVADSFKGLPAPEPGRFPADAGDTLHTYAKLAVPADVVRSNFARYDLLDDQVRFLEGWFEDTLPDAPIERLAVIRMDGDMYGSTWVTLETLYPKLSSGGYLIVDDYGAIPACRQAVMDFRDRNAVSDAIQEIDWTGVYWRKV